MPILRTLRRYQHTATPDQDRWAIRDELRASRRALLDGEFAVALARAQRAHDASQNSPLLHARAHLARAFGWTLQGRTGAALAELPLVMMAVPAALVRRASGLQPGSAGGSGLLETWRMRQDPPSLRDPMARPVRVSDEGS